MRYEDSSQTGSHNGTEAAGAEPQGTMRPAAVPTAQGPVAPTPVADVLAAASPASLRVIPGPDGVVTLPAGVELSDVHVVGRDLVIDMPDGTHMVIVDGAVFVPQLILGTIEVPPTNLAALLIDAEPKPAAGNPQSSGGNFAVPVGPLDPGAPLGDLLPPTELSYTPPEFRDVGFFLDDEPTVVIETPDQPAGVHDATATVDESGLPQGSDAPANSESTSGHIVIDSSDTPTSVTINGVDVTSVGQVITGDHGTLVVTGITPDGIDYTYTLTGPTTGDTTHDDFTVVVTDSDGDTDTATLTVDIVDDVPTARNDSATGDEANSPITINVFGNDTAGADGVNLTTGVHTVPGSLSGNGTLVYNDDGSFTYTPTAGEEGDVTFQYQITDGDGDTSTATVTLHLLHDSTPTILIADGSDTSVDEAALSIGSAPESTGETANGQLVVTTGNDTVGSLVVNGVDVTNGGTVAGDHGTLTVTLANGTYSYSYVLTEATTDVPGVAETDTFGITVTDSDGDPASTNLVIDIVDDVPTARNDGATQTVENTPVAIDVLANDTTGADGVSLVNGVALVAGSLTGHGNLVYNADGSFTYTPAAGEEGDIRFEYQITDGDGDTSTATATIHLQPDSTPVVVIETPDNPAGAATATASVDEAGLPARGSEPAGSNAAANSETTVGTIVVTATDQPSSVAINGTTVAAVGQVIHGAFGDLTITSIAGGAVGYSYTLADNTRGDNTADQFIVTVTDADGDHATASLTIDIVDDVPTARNDVASQASENLPITIGVIANDTLGADSVNPVSGIKLVPGTLSGNGALVYNNNGSFTYTPGAGEQGDVTFKYQITDTDGDTSTATVTLHLRPDSVPTILVAQGSDTSVDEAALPFGSNPSSPAETATGQLLTTTGGDAVGLLVVNGVNVTNGGVVHGAYGDLTVTRSGGVYNYSYHLTTSSTDGPGAETDNFAVTVTDSDGDSAGTNLVITIVDDVPTARNDVASQAVENAPVIVNVFGNDTPGADGVNLVSAVKLVPGSLLGQGTVIYNVNGSFTYTPGAGEQGDVTFRYQITDGDGDTSIATVTIHLKADSIPTIRIATGSDTTVDESALPVGSNPASTGEVAVGKLVTTTGNDSIATLVVKGVDVTHGGTVQGAHGVLTVTIVNGIYNYSYTLTDVTTDVAGVAETDTFGITVTDSDGDPSSTSLVIDIVDDVPTARNDSATQALENTPVTVNVFGNDTPGADGVNLVSGVHAVAGSLSGTGSLAYNANGSFTYTPGAGEQGDVTFQYQITDGDGDTSTATVTIHLQPDSIPTILVAAGSDTSVDEGALPVGSNPGSNGEFAAGQLVVTTGNDTVGSLVVNGVDVTNGGTVIGAHGTLTVTLAAGTYSYNYQLTDVTTDVAGVAETDTFGITVTDSDGDPSSTSLVIDIVDDVPTARNDSATQALENTPVTVNVFGNDTPGADGVNLVSGVHAVAGSLSGTGSLAYNANGSFTYTPGAGEQGDVTFQYQITDGDGDTSTATVTIHLQPDSIPTILVAAGSDTSVDEGALPVGSNPGSNGEFAAGQLVVTTGNDTVGSLVVNGVDVTNGGTVIGAHGTLTVTLAAGTYSYNYQLTDVTTDVAGVAETDTFGITVTDSDGDPSSTSLVIDIADDVPTAHDDSGSVAEGGTLSVPATGVLGNDVFGADGATLTGVAAGTSVGTPVSGHVGTAIAGAFGTLTLNANGSYTYVSTANVVPAAGAVDHFVYTITDGDGDTSTVHLDITLTDSGIAAGAVTGNVNEAALDMVKDAGDLAAGTVTGSQPALTTESVSGTLTGSGGVGGLTYSLVGSATTAHGQIQINPNGTYTYTLTSPFDGPTLDNGTVNDGTETFTYRVTDANGNTTTNTITINVADDVPTAHDDSGSVAEGGTLSVPATGVLGNDVFGADGATLTGVAAGTSVGTPVSGHVGTAIAGAFGTLTLNANGSYTYVSTANVVPAAGAVDHFVYTITDGDGDTSTVHLDITLTDSGIAAGAVTGNVNEAALDMVKDAGDLAAGTVTGSQPALTTESVSGTLTGSGGVGGLTYSLVGSATTAHGQIQINPNGTYTYTLTSPFDGPTLDNGTVNDGTETFTYRVTDANGNTTTNTITINVADDVPTAHDDSGSVAEGGTLSVPATGVLGNDVFGADGATLTGVAAGTSVGTPVSGHVGTAIAGAFGTLTLNANGSYTYVSTANVVPAAGAVDHFVYTITDGDGDTSTVHLDITLTDSGIAAGAVTGNVNEAALDMVKDAGDLAAGTVTGSQPALTTESVSGTLTGSGGVGGLTYSLVGSATTAHGQIQINPNGTYTYTLTSPFDGPTLDNGTVNDGTETFTYRVTDANGNTTTNTITINVADDVPTAHDDSGSVAEGGTLSVPATGVLGNDVFGADGATLTGVAAGTSVGTPVSGHVGTAIAGAFGTLTLNANGSYTYVSTANVVPAAGAVDHFVYTITDGDGDTSTVHLDITLTDSGIAAGAVTGNVNEAALDMVKDAGDLAAGTVTGSQPALTTESVSGTLTGSGGVGGLTYSLVGSATTAHGQIQINPNGTYTYTLTSPFDGPTLDNGTVNDGTETFTYRVTDANGNTTTNTITINVADDVPTAHDDSGSVAEGGTLSVPATGVLGNDVFGADGATLTGVAAGTSVGTPVSGHVGTAIAGAFGTLTLNANGSYTYVSTANVVPAAGAVDHFVYTITDGDGDTSTVHLDITLTDSGIAAGAVTGNVNEAALDMVKDAGDLAAGTVTGSQPALTTESVSGTLTGSGGVGGLTYSLVGSATTAHGQIQINPNGTYTYTLTSPFDGPTLDNGTVNDGTETFTYRVTDANGNTTTNTITINVADDVPTAHDDSGSVAEGGTLSVPATGVLGNDVFGADGATLTGVAAGTSVGTPVSGHVGTAIAGAFGTLTLNANGSYTYVSTANVVPAAGAVDHFVYTITDGDGDTSTVHLDITLTDSGIAAGAVTGNVNEAALDMVKDAGDLAAGTVTGSQPALTTESVSGTLTGSGGVGGLTYSLVGSATTAHGQIQINPNGTYTYTLTSPFDGPTLDNGTVNDGTETFTYRVTDANGNTTTNTITINVADDVPTAFIEPSQNVAEGTSLTGSFDFVPGADGATVTAINGIPLVFGAGGNSQAIDVGDGTIVVKANGSYTFTADPAVIGNGAAGGTFTVTDGDGDTSTKAFNFVITDANHPTGGTAAASVDDDALPGGNPASTTGDLPDANADADNNQATFSGTLGGSLGGDGAGANGFSFAALNGQAGTVGQEAVTYSYNSATNTLTATGPRGDLFTVQITNPATGAYKVTLLDNIIHAAGGDENDATVDLNYLIKDADGSPASGTLTITFDDDAPTLSSAIQNADANNVPTSAVSSGSLHFVPGADGPGTVTISPNLTGITSGNHALLTSQSGNVLTAYADVNNDGVLNDGPGSAVFTITVDPTGGPSGGTYTFDLIQKLDGQSVTVPLGNNTAFGAGPSNTVLVSQPGLPNLVLVTGYHSTQQLDLANYTNGFVPANLLVQGGVNASTQGYGVNSNNFDALTLIRFDFGPASDYDGAGPYTPPALTMQTATSATFDLFQYTAADTIQFLAHYSNGTTGLFTFHGGQQDVFATITAPTGLTIEYIDAYTPNGGSGKLDLASIGVTKTTVDLNIPVDLTLNDGDGDPVKGSFTIHVKDGLTPTSATPVVLDLDGNGAHFVGTDAGVTYDYNGDGVREATAWVGHGDAILVRDANHDGAVNNASEFVFGGNGLTDIEALHAQYGDTLDANDADFGSFKVWADANGNGDVDAGELLGLAEAGIKSISLVTDGKAYAAANGDVVVAGTGTFTRADGSTGSTADAAFRIEDRGAEAARAATAANSNVALAAAIAAAGLGATPVAAHTPASNDQAAQDSATATSGATAAPAASVAGTTDHSVAVSTAQTAVEAHAAPTNSRSTHVEAAHDAHDMAAEAKGADHGPSSLLQATDAPATVHAAANPVAPMIAMPSAQAMIAAGMNGTAKAGVDVKSVVADALHDGHQTGQIDALLNALPGHGAGSQAAPPGLASHAANDVSQWDTGDQASFVALHNVVMPHEAMMLHHDAVQPAVNG